MRSILKMPGEGPKVVEIDNELRSLQEAVGGHIEHIGIGHGIGILCDEEGRFKGPLVNGRPTSLPFNFFLITVGSLVGPVLFVGEKGEEFVSLDDAQVDRILGFLKMTEEGM